MREKSRGKEHNLVIVNVSPITYGHVLLVPSVKSGLPQVFTENSLRLAIETVALSNHRLILLAIKFVYYILVILEASVCSPTVCYHTHQSIIYTFMQCILNIFSWQ